MSSGEFLGNLRQDLRYTLRVLWKNPVFTGIAILTLALGVGANTAMFSVISAVLLHPLPYSQPSQLVRLARTTNQDSITMTEYVFWKEHSKAFSSIAGYRGITERHLVTGNDREWIKAMTVTADFLRVLKVTPYLGREFNSLEARTTGPQSVILSYALWRDFFKSDPAVLGRSIRLDNGSYSIIGVLPHDFWFPQAADALIALRATGGVEDNGSNTAVIARLKNGVSVEQARAENPSVTESFRAAHVGRVSDKYRGLIAVSYQDWLVGNVRLNLLLLFGTTGFLFLIVCSNLVSLSLARLASREKEVAVRLAVGSTSGRLLRQFLIENAVLSSIGILAGLFVAHGLLGGLVGLLPFNLPTSSPISLDKNVLMFAGLIFFVMTLLFTLVPVLNAGRLNVHDALKSIGQVVGGGTSHHRIRSFLVVGQLALSAMLVLTAWLLIQSLYHLHQERLGFQPQGLITFGTPLAPDRYPNTASTWRFASEITERIQALPGVRGVAAINVLPLSGGINLPTEREGHPEQSVGGMEIRLVTPDYFKVMGIALRQGRSFGSGDTEGNTPVVIVNEALAGKWWPQGGSGLGERLIVGRFQGQDYSEIRDVPREIVGIADDTKTINLKETARPTIFIPLPQAKDVFVGMTGKLAWTIRVESLTGVSAELRHTIEDFDGTQQIQDLRTMNELVASTTANSRFDAWLFGTFAGLALLLAAIGVYGVLSFSVSQRRQEIGTRMALGASRQSVLWLFLRQGFILTAIGLGFGLVGAFFLTRSMASLLYGIKSNDPISFFAVSLLLLVVGALASYIPSSRATRIDPMVALRYE